MGNDALTLKMGNQTTTLNLGKSTTQAMQGIELKVGANSIVLDQSGITLKGLLIKLEGALMTQIKAPMVHVNADGMLMLKGGLTMIG
jgi:type VI secretion system secreted protein VgrG